MIDVNINDLIKYAQTNRKLIAISKIDPLIKLNYTDECQYKGIWNQFTRLCRGIIIDIKTNQVIAHPFDKFFNEFEYIKLGIDIPLGKPYWITEKLDGVLIIPYRYQGQLRLSSRGSFQNEYIDKAYRLVKFKDLPLEHYSFMFELISPEYSQGGFLITKYEMEELILVGMRDNLSDRLLKPPEIIAFARQYGLKPYTIFQNTIEELKALQNTVVGSTSEGWVVFFDYEDGFLVKLKRLEYLHLFRAMKNVNPKTVLTMLLNNQFEEFLKSLPEELHLMVMEIYHTIQQDFERKYNEILKIFNSIPEEVKQDQKDYSLYIIQHYSQGLLKYLYKYKSTQKKEDLQQIFYRESL